MDRSHAGPGFLVIVLMTISFFGSLPTVEGQVRLQTTEERSARISELQKQIRTAEYVHANAEQLGTLWLHLADAYQGELDQQSAEDAFAHALGVLRPTTEKELYANALDGIATVYTATGRLDIAEKCLRQALKLEDTQRGSAAEAETLVNLATVLMLKHRYEEAVKELSAALRFLETQADSDVGKLFVVYVARSRALCDMKQCEEGLRDLERALALGNGRFAVNSVGMISIAAVRGFEQIRAGSVEEGGETFRQAMRLADSRTDLSTSARAEIRLRILESYSQSLRFAHRKQERKRVQEELARVKVQEPRGCNGCTVSAAILGMVLP
jgi:tetratricopeptide (TPR) repeat protein